VRADDALPLAAAREQEARAQHVLLDGAELLRRSERALDRLARLRVRVAAAARRGAADRDVRAAANGAGVGGGFLEAAALPERRPQR
jgi:hypothetical protein